MISFLRVLFVVGLVMWGLGTLMTVGALPDLATRPAIVAMPQLLWMGMVACFGLLLSAVSGGALLLTTHLVEVRDLLRGTGRPARNDAPQADAAEMGRPVRGNPADDVEAVDAQGRKSLVRGTWAD